MSTSEPSDAELDSSRQSPPRLLPPDLSDLYRAISRAATVRRCWNPDAPPYRFDRFEAYGAVIGGMGLVIEARDPELERKVAIKFWKQSGPAQQEALLAEAKTLARLTHPNVVTVHETGRWGERVFFVMEWIDGVDGQTWMKRPRTLDEVCEVFAEAGKGLAAAHDARIQHRDFKPANMLVGDDGRVVDADFGIADSLRTLDDGDSEWGTPAGTPAYMAPERLRGGRGDARSDQFSFCVALWRGLYGRRPFAGVTGEEMLASIERGELREDPEVAVPRWLSELARKGLAEDPSARHASMHELLARLRAGASAEGVDVGLGPGDERRRTSFVIAMLVTLVATLGVMLLRTTSQPPAEPAPPLAQEPVGVDQFQVILTMVASDDFAGAKSRWLDARTIGEEIGLSDEESLTIARACLERAKRLRSRDKLRAMEAALLAEIVAAFVIEHGARKEVRSAASLLDNESELVLRGLARSTATTG